MESHVRAGLLRNHLQGHLPPLRPDYDYIKGRTNLVPQNINNLHFAKATNISNCRLITADTYSSTAKEEHAPQSHCVQNVPQTAQLRQQRENQLDRREIRQ